MNIKSYPVGSYILLTEWARLSSPHPPKSILKLELTATSDAVSILRGRVALFRSLSHPGYPGGALEHSFAPHFDPGKSLRFYLEAYQEEPRMFLCGLRPKKLWNATREILLGSLTIVSSEVASGVLSRGCRTMWSRPGPGASREGSKFLQIS